MRDLWYVFVFFLFVPGALGQVSEMSIESGVDGSAHISILVVNPPDLAELKSLIDEPRIRDIYGQQLGLVFNDVDDLELSVEAGVFIISFDSSIASVRDGDLVVEPRGFDGYINSMSKLSISIPEGFEFQSSDPSPTSVSENTVEWRDADFIPAVSFRKKSTFPSNYVVAALVFLVVAASLVFVLMKRR